MYVVCRLSADWVKSEGTILPGSRGLFSHPILRSATVPPANEPVKPLTSYWNGIGSQTWPQLKKLFKVSTKETTNVCDTVLYVYYILFR